MEEITEPVLLVIVAKAGPSVCIAIIYLTCMISFWGSQEGAFEKHIQYPKLFSIMQVWLV